MKMGGRQVSPCVDTPALVLLGPCTGCFPPSLDLFRKAREYDIPARVAWNTQLVYYCRLMLLLAHTTPFDLVGPVHGTSQPRSHTGGSSRQASSSSFVPLRPSRALLASDVERAWKIPAKKRIPAPLPLFLCCSKQ